MTQWVHVAKPVRESIGTGVFDTGVQKEVYEAVRARTRGLRTQRYYVAILPTGDEVRVDARDHSWTVFVSETSDMSHEAGTLVYRERVTKGKAAPLACFDAYLDEYTLEESRAGPLRLSRRSYSSGEEIFEVAATGRTRAAALDALQGLNRVTPDWVWSLHALDDDHHVGRRAQDRCVQVLAEAEGDERQERALRLTGIFHARGHRVPDLGDALARDDARHHRALGLGSPAVRDVVEGDGLHCREIRPLRWEKPLH